MLITSGVTVCICTKTENPLIRHWCDWHGNRQTDGRTDGRMQTDKWMPAKTISASFSVAGVQMNIIIWYKIKVMLPYLKSMLVNTVAVTYHKSYLKQ